MAGETIRDVVVKVGAESKPSKLTPPDSSEWTKQVRDMKKADADFHKQVEENNESQRKMEEEREKAIKDIRKETDKAAGSLKDAGSGAFTLARGVAFLSASGSQPLEKMAKNIAAIQGTFDTLKGSVEVLKNVRQGVTSMLTAMAAAKAQAASSTAANAALATSNTAVATTSVAAAGGLSAMMVALGPIALAGAAVAAVLFTLRKQTEETEKVVGQEKERTDALEKTLSILEKMSSVDQKRHDVDKRRSALVNKELNAKNEIQKIDARSLRDARTVINRSNFAGQGGAPKFGGNEQEALEIARQNIKSQEVFAPKEQERIGKDIADARKVENQLLQMSARSMERRLDVQKEERRVIQDKIEIAEKEAELAQKTLDIANKKVQAAIQEKLSAAERFGMLSREEQLEARRIAKKSEDDRTFDETKRFSELTGGPKAQALLRGAAAERATEGGFDDVAKAAGFDEAIKQAEELQRRAKQFADVEEEAARETVSALQRMINASKKQSEETLNILEEVLDGLEASNARLEMMRKKSEERKAVNVVVRE